MKSLRTSAIVVLSLAGLSLLLAAGAPAASSLSISIGDSADPIAVDAELTYSIEVANGGPEAATGVVVSDELPNHLDFVSVSSSQGAVCKRKGKKISCELGTIAAGAGASVQIKVKPRQQEQITNTATVTSAGPYAETKSDVETTVVGGAVPGAPGCGGQQATIVGTDGADTLAGTDRRDVIVALGGNDTIASVGGRDVVCGSSGDDVLRGGPGADTLRGGSGNDRNRAGSGDDLLAGGGGNDALGGGAGNDVLNGGPGNDTCAGGPGRDVERRC